MSVSEEGWDGFCHTHCLLSPFHVSAEEESLIPTETKEVFAVAGSSFMIWSICPASLSVLSPRGQRGLPFWPLQHPLAKGIPKPIIPSN